MESKNKEIEKILVEKRRLLEKIERDYFSRLVTQGGDKSDLCLLTQKYNSLMDSYPNKSLILPSDTGYDLLSPNSTLKKQNPSRQYLTRLLLDGDREMLKSDSYCSTVGKE